MNMSRKGFKEYLFDTLNVKVSPRKWLSGKSLPIYLQDAYEFFKCEILNVPCLLMVARDETEQAPVVIKKQIKKVKEVWGEEIIYMRGSISSYNRKRLIEHKISFVVPENQMYLPFLGIDLREHFRKIQSKRKQFRPSTQAVVLYALLDTHNQKYTPKELANRLGYSSMALTRAFDEIESGGFGTITQEGRERVLQFPEGKRKLWEKAHTYMRSPVKKWIQVRNLEVRGNKVLSGLTALANYSMISAPDYETYAIDSNTWNTQRKNSNIEQLPAMEKEGYKIEIWHYNPNIFARQGIADPFSLYLSLQHNSDERIQSALEEMMERIEW